MKTKVRILIPVIILEVIAADMEFFRITKNKLCNEILLKFSLRFRSNYSNELYFEDKEYIQFNLSKDNQRYYMELLEQNKDLTESDIIREIFLTYAIYHPSLREMYLNREKISFISNTIKEYRALKIDTDNGVIEGRIEKLFRCKKLGYLKIKVGKQEYYLAKIRIIS